MGNVDNLLTDKQCELIEQELIQLRRMPQLIAEVRARLRRNLTTPVMVTWTAGAAAARSVQEELLRLAVGTEQVEERVMQSIRACETIIERSRQRNRQTIRG